MKRSIALAGVTLAALTLLFVIAALVFISTGAYNIAATSPHAPLTRWILNTTQEQSVRVRADEMPTPPRLDSAAVQHGFEEYHEMCVVCHGAPGVERGTLGKGMNPKPPDLAEEAAEWSDRELFWITKYGIKLAGMPAFGVTHSNEEVWGIVAFIRRLQEMTPEEYQRLAAEAGPAEMHGADAHPSAHAGVQPIAAQAHDRMQPAAPAPVNVHAADHGRVAGAGRHAAARAPSHRAMTRMDHADMPTRAATAQQAAAEPAHDATGATAKLKALAAELLRDPVVMARIQSDSALRRRWQSESVRSQLATPR